jgi:hypothetical protein
MGMLASPSGVEDLTGREQLRIIYDEMPSEITNSIKFAIVLTKIAERDVVDVIDAVILIGREINRDPLKNLTEKQGEAINHFLAILKQFCPPLRDTSSRNMVSAQTMYQ